MPRWVRLEPAIAARSRKATLTDCISALYLFARSTRYSASSRAWATGRKSRIRRSAIDNRHRRPYHSSPAGGKKITRGVSLSHATRLWQFRFPNRCSGCQPGLAVLLLVRIERDVLRALYGWAVRRMLTTARRRASRCRVGLGPASGGRFRCLRVWRASWRGRSAGAPWCGCRRRCTCPPP